MASEKPLMLFDIVMIKAQRCDGEKGRRKSFKAKGGGLGGFGLHEK